MISINFVIEKLTDDDVTPTFELSKDFKVFANKCLNPVTILYIKI